jgi:trans-aconitate methyltransferase
MKWDSSLYDRKHAFVTRYGEGVLELLAPEPGERILDVGCGTGHLTKKIAEAGAAVVGLDSSAEMIETARASYPEIEFVVADAADFAFDEGFDAVFSNAALHWVHPPEQAVICLSRALKAGGRLVAEFGGKGNVAKITNALQQAIREMTQAETTHGNYFPSVGEYATLLERHGLEVGSAWLFDRLTKLEAGEDGLADWIRMFRGKMMAAVPDELKPAVIERVEARLRAELFIDGSWHVDYRRLRVVARKE